MRRKEYKQNTVKEDSMTKRANMPMETILTLVAIAVLFAIIIIVVGTKIKGLSP